MALYGETPSNIIIKDLPKRETPEVRDEEPEAFTPSRISADATPAERIKASEKTLQTSVEKFHDGVTIGQIYDCLGVSETASVGEKTKAIEAFQTQNGLRGTGAIDPSTLEALDKATGDDRNFSRRVEAGHGKAALESDGSVTVGVSPADGEVARPFKTPEEIQEFMKEQQSGLSAEVGLSQNVGNKPPVASGTSPETDKSASTISTPDTPPPSTQTESAPAETGTPKTALGDFDQAARLNMIQQVAGQLDTPEEIQEFGEATQGKSFAEVYALASTVPGINKDNLRSAIEGTEGYGAFRENIQSLSRDPNLDEQTKTALQDLGISGDVSTEDMLKMSQYGTAKGENQTPLSDKLHAEHTHGYINPDEQNIVTTQPTEYRDMTGKPLDERMQAYGLSPAVQERIREQVQIRTNADDVSPAGSTTPYLTKSFDGANMAELSNTSEANMGDLSNDLGREVTQTKFVDFVGGGRALTTEIDTTTGKTVVPGVGELVYPSGKQVRGEDYGIRITDPDNRYGAPVGSVVSLQDPRCPVYKAGADGVMKEIGYINSPDPQTYAGNGKFVGKDPFEKIEVAELEIKKDKY